MKKSSAPQLNGRHRDRKTNGHAVRVIGNAAEPIPARPEMITPERVVMSIRQRFNPLRQVTPDLLSSQLDQFFRGWLWPISRTWDAMQRRDDRLASVVPKRESDVARNGFEIVQLEKSAEAEQHQDALEFFFKNLTVQHALDENQVGRFPLLVRQMMKARGMKYACHEIQWQQNMSGLTALFRFAPPWYFENITGRLRFLEQDFAYYGTDMPEDQWLVTVADLPLMEASSVAYMFKWMPLKDWVNYTEKFGFPLIVGECNAAFDSPEWKGMVASLQNIGIDWSGVFNLGSKVSALDVSRNGEAPFKALVEEMNKAMTILWRGGDLSTQSHHGGGQGQGASLQKSETEVLTEDDAQWIAETLNTQISRKVIAYVFGATEAKAELKIVTADQRNPQVDIQALQVLVPMGAKISTEDAQERFGFPIADEADDLLQPPATPAPEVKPPEPGTESNSLLQQARQLVATALREPDANLSNALASVRKQLPGLLD